MIDNRKVSVVILNYNSEDDTKICIDQISSQQSVWLSIILVDNASRPDSVAELCDWLGAHYPDAFIGSEAEVSSVITDTNFTETSGQIYFIKLNENRGYSAGNNIGIRFADALGADGVLIANPDMRIEDRHYLAKLAMQLFADDRNHVAASRILGLDGKDQNPQREPSFWEELLWPRVYLVKFFGGRISYVVPTMTNNSLVVPKVSGCCMLLRMSHIRDTDFLDENVFLYCEEAILSARVHKRGGRILYVPNISAVHAHIRSEKGNAGNRMLLFIKSRIYYLEKYSGLKRWRLRLLKISYASLALINVAKSRLPHIKS